VVHVAGVPVGVGTCWEVAFDRALRQSVRNGAQLLAVPANNATFGEMMTEQQLAFSKVRAVELDRYVVVASTTRQRGDRSGRPRAGQDRVLHTGLYRRPGAPEDRPDPGRTLGPRCSGC
jgi:predicted amidohydrolase